jgi:hypothetical protein
MRLDSKTEVPDLDNHIREARQQTSSSVTHIRTNMRGERDTVRALLADRKGKGKLCVIDTIELTDSESGSKLPTTKPSKRPADDDNDTRTWKKRKLLSPTSSSTSSSPSLKWRLPSPTSSSTSSSLSLRWRLPILPSEGTQLKPWPRGYHVCDIAEGLEAMDDPGLVAEFPDRQERFEQIFGRTWKPSTFYDHQAQWRALSKMRKEHGKALGRVPQALWSVYVKG